MERIKIHALKQSLEETRRLCPDAVNREILDKIENAIRNIPAKYLRITKMYETVMRIKKETIQPTHKYPTLQTVKE